MVKKEGRMTCILNSSTQSSLDNFVFCVLFLIFTEWEESLIRFPFRSLKVNTLGGWGGTIIIGLFLITGVYLEVNLVQAKYYLSPGRI